MLIDATPVLYNLAWDVQAGDIIDAAKLEHAAAERLVVQSDTELEALTEQLEQAREQVRLLGSESDSGSGSAGDSSGEGQKGPAANPFAAVLASERASFLEPSSIDALRASAAAFDYLKVYEREVLLRRSVKEVGAPEIVRFVPAGSSLEAEIEKAVVQSYAKQAIAVAKAGLTVDFKAKRELELPDELTRVLRKDRKLAKAFDALTPGRRRAYVHRRSSLWKVPTAPPSP